MSVRAGGLSVKRAAELLGVSDGTVRNWLRLGKLAALTPNEIEKLKKTIDNGGGLLCSRRNKSALKAAREYGGYLAAAGLPAELFSRRYSEAEIKVILAEAALRLFADGENLVSAFLCGELDGGFAGLVRGLLAETLTADPIIVKALAPVLSARWKPDPSQDVLGYIYMSLLPQNVKRERGAYYTPSDLVKRACSLVGEAETVLDPCCGSGNFLLELASRLGPERVFAADIDPLAVAIARINMRLRFPSLSDGFLMSHIVCADFFELPTDCAAVAGNPPWGGSPEAAGEFLLRALKILPEGGRLCFVLPQALLTARRHGAVREELLSSARLTSVDYVGNRFDSVACPSVILAAEKSAPFGTRGCTVNSEFTINTERGGEPCLSLNVTDEEYEKLRRMKSLPNAVYLKGRARFALGIVTGGNSAALLSSPENGAEPVIRGSDVSPMSISPPASYLRFEPSSLQQCAPEWVYRESEKIVYRFIGKRPVFAVDTLGRLTLNSCNVILPRIEGLGTDYIAAVLNSEAVGFFLEKSFDTSKWLRRHLEEVPIPFVSEEIQRRAVENLDRDGFISSLYFG